MADPIPGGVDVAEALVRAKDAYQKALASVSQKRSRTLQDYGYSATGFDAGGHPLGLQTDVNSTYGQLQQMLQRQAAASMQAEEESTGRGFGFGSGLGNQAASRVRYDAGAENTAFGKHVLDDFDALQAEQYGAETEYNNASYLARQAAARAALEAQNFRQEPTAYDDYSDLVPYPVDPFADNPSDGGDREFYPAPTGGQWDHTGQLAPGPITRRPAGITPKGRTIKWGGKQQNAKQLAATLARQGVSPRVWAQNHPAAAKKIGFKPPKPPKKR